MILATSITGCKFQRCHSHLGTGEGESFAEAGDPRSGTPRRQTQAVLVTPGSAHPCSVQRSRQDGAVHPSASCGTARSTEDTQSLGYAERLRTHSLSRRKPETYTSFFSLALQKGRWPTEPLHLETSHPLALKYGGVTRKI